MDHISKENAIPQKKIEFDMNSNKAKFKNLDSLKLLILTKVYNLKIKYGLNGNANMLIPNNYFNTYMINSFSTLVKLNNNFKFKLNGFNYTTLFKYVRDSYWGLKSFKSINNRKVGAKSFCLSDNGRKRFFSRRFNNKRLRKTRSSRLLSRLHKICRYSTTYPNYISYPLIYKKDIVESRLSKRSWRRFTKIKKPFFSRRDNYVNLSPKRIKGRFKTYFSLTKRSKFKLRKKFTRPYSLERKLVKGNIMLINTLGLLSKIDPVGYYDKLTNYQPWRSELKNRKMILYLSRYVNDFSKTVMKDQMLNKSVLEDTQFYNELSNPDFTLLSKRVAIKFLYGRKTRMLCKFKNSIFKKITKLNKKKKKSLKLLFSKSRLISKLTRSPTNARIKRFKWSEIYANTPTILHELGSRPAFKRWYIYKGDIYKSCRLAKIRSIALLKLMLVSGNLKLKNLIKSKHKISNFLNKRFISRKIYYRLLMSQRKRVQLRKKRLTSLFNRNGALVKNCKLSKGSLNNNYSEHKPSYKGALINTLYDIDTYDTGYFFKVTPTSPTYGSSDLELFNLERTINFEYNNSGSYMTNRGTESKFCNSSMLISNFKYKLGIKSLNSLRSNLNNNLKKKSTLSNKLSLNKPKKFNTYRFKKLIKGHIIKSNLILNNSYYFRKSISTKHKIKKLFLKKYIENFKLFKFKLKGFLKKSIMSAITKSDDQSTLSVLTPSYTNDVITNKSTKLVKKSSIKGMTVNSKNKPSRSSKNQNKVASKVENSTKNNKVSFFDKYPMGNKSRTGKNINKSLTTTTNPWIKVKSRSRKSKKKILIKNLGLKSVLRSYVKLRRWLSSKKSTNLKSLLMRKLKRANLNARRLSLFKLSKNLNNKLPNLKVFYNKNINKKLLISKKTIKLSNVSGQAIIKGQRFVISKKKNPNSTVKSLNLASNLYNHLQPKFSLLLLDRLNYTRSKTLSKTKHSFFRNLKVSMLSRKLISFFKINSKEDKLDFKNKLIFKNLTLTESERRILYLNIEKYTSSKEAKYFSKNSLAFFRDTSVVNTVINLSKSLRVGKIRVNKKKKKTILTLKLRLLNLRLKLFNKKKNKLKKLFKSKRRGSNKRKIFKKIFKNKKFLVKIKSSKMTTKKLRKYSKKFKKKSRNLRKKKKLSLIIKSKVLKKKTNKKKLNKHKYPLIVRKFKKKLRKLHTFRKLRNSTSSNHHISNILSSNPNTNLLNNTLKVLSPKIRLLNQDKFFIRGLKKGQFLENQLKIYNSKKNYHIPANVIKLSNMYRWWTVKRSYLKKVRLKLLRSRINPELYLVSKRSGLIKRKFSNFNKFKTFKLNTPRRFRFGNLSSRQLLRWKKYKKEVLLENKLLKSKNSKKKVIKLIWRKFKLKQRSLFKRKYTKGKYIAKMWARNSRRKLLNSKKGKFNIRSVQWVKDRFTKVWSKKFIKSRYFKRRSKNKLIEKVNKYASANKFRIGRSSRFYERVHAKKLKSSFTKKMAILESFKTICRPIVNLGNYWNLNTKLLNYQCKVGSNETYNSNSPLTNYSIIIKKLLQQYLLKNKFYLKKNKQDLEKKTMTQNSLIGITVENFCLINTYRIKLDLINILSKTILMYRSNSLDFNSTDNHDLYRTNLTDTKSIQSSKINKIKIVKTNSNVIRLFKTKSTKTKSTKTKSTKTKSTKTKSTKTKSTKTKSTKAKSIRIKSIIRSLKNSNRVKKLKNKFLRNRFKLNSLGKFKPNISKTLGNKLIKQLCTKHLLESSTVYSSYLPLSLLINSTTTNISSCLSNNSAKQLFSSFVFKYLYMVYKYKKTYKTASNYNLKIGLNYNLLIPNNVLRSCYLGTTTTSRISNPINATSKQLLLPKFSIKNNSKSSNMSNLLSSNIVNLISSSLDFKKLIVINYDLLSTLSSQNLLVYKISKSISNSLNYEFGLLAPTFFIDEVISTILLALRYKDASMLMDWVTYFFNKIPIKKHKKALAFLKKLFKNLERTKRLYKLGCTGFMLDVRGKVGVSGSSKKRHVAITYGKRSASNKLVRWSYNKGLIYTKTGVLGVTVIIYY